MNLKILLSFLTLLYVVIFGFHISNHSERIRKNIFPVRDPRYSLSLELRFLKADCITNTGLLGTSSRDSKDERKRGSVVSIGKLPFGSAVMLVSGGEGISVIGADAVQVSSNLRFDGVTSYSNSQET
ncbi:hypothetical protein L9Z17_03335 [Leptospira noguchii]|nr:hypothetical protein [Leptospira noguchii]